jgi:hypothetical protein
MEDKNMRNNVLDENGKSGLKQIGIFVILSMLMIQSAAALQVKTFDKDMFEIDAFSEGDVIVILAESNITPKLTIQGLDISEKEMEKIEDGKYRAMLQIDTEGEYTIIATAGKEIATAKVFVVKNLDLNWNELEQNLEQEKIDNAKKIEDAREQAMQNLAQQEQEQQEQEKSLLQKILDFVKKSWVMVFGK